MKTVKIHNKDYVNLEYLLDRVGAVYKVNGRAFAEPSAVYWTKKDLKLMERSLFKEFKKEHPYSTTKKLKSSVGMHMLNLSPNELKGEGLKNGYMLVDENKIAEAKEKTEQYYKNISEENCSKSFIQNVKEISNELIRIFVNNLYNMYSSSVLFFKKILHKCKQTDN